MQGSFFMPVRSWKSLLEIQTYGNIRSERKPEKGETTPEIDLTLENNANKGLEPRRRGDK